MFHRERWIDWIASIVLIVAAASCDGLGAGCGCSFQPLPQGGLPPDQTLEGGAQVRVTPAGFKKITDLIPAVVNDALAGGFCLPQDKVINIGVAEATICGTNVGQCRPGCPVQVTLLDTSSITASGQTINIKMRLDVHSDVHIAYEVFFVFDGTCDADFDINNGLVDIDVALGIDPNTGELTIQPADINRIDFTDLQVSGDCGAIDDIVDAALNLFASLLDSFLGDLILDVVRPLINDLLQGLLPDPLGIEGMVALGDVLGPVAAEESSSIEMRGVPGGFVEVVGNGLTLGVILGVNADRNPATRTPDKDSEPAYCVPALPAPDFAAAPASLPKSPRGTFRLLAAEEFRGVPDPAGDVAIGLSETALDLVGHHAITSGALCLGVGTKQIPALDLGRIAILVPSFAALGNPDGKDPLLLVTRPIQPIDFTIGAGTEASPSIMIHLSELEIDFYAFLFERYVRGFTVRLDMDLGVNVEFTTTADGKPAILPVLTGLSSDNIQITALNTDFLREQSSDLEATLPSIIDLAVPLISDGLAPITLPDIAGFKLGDLRVGKVVTSEDEFMAIFGTMVGSTALNRLTETYPSVRKVLGESQAAPERARTRATLRGVYTPPAERVRAALGGQADGMMPEIVIDVEPHDELGRKLEWTWNINGGMWRPFTSATPLVIRDRALAWQGRYEIEVRARVAGDYRTLDTESTVIPVIIDSVGPRIHSDRARLRDGKIVVPATDLVSADEAIELAYGRPGDDTPATAWTSAGLALGEAENLAVDRTIAVYARDELGNVSVALVDVSPWLGFHGSSSGGCACAAGEASAQSLGGLALVAGLTALLLLAQGRRRRFVHGPIGARRPRRTPVSPLARRFSRALPGVLFCTGVVIAASALPACDCGGGVPSCAIAEDCDDYCPDGTIGLCFDNQCLCQDDLSYGWMGQYSAMALSPSGSVWVSGYNSTYGDLAVARWTGEGRISDDTWKFVDGVPEGPVTVDRSTVRGGIEAAGEDVGKYTSIAVNALDEVMVSYFDQDKVSLKFAANFGGTWQIHTVDAGTVPTDPEIAFEVVGQYSSLTLSNQGRPGIAYFAHVSEGGGISRTEVRFASAQTTTPAGPADWITYVIDTATVPPTDPNNPDPLSIPPGVGLFIASVRQSDQTPVVVYYDRINGNLKMSRFELEAGTFTPPEVLDGVDTDVGWYPSVAIDPSDNVHVAYVSASNDDLMYINTIDRTPELVDSGYRIVGTTEEGLPKPEFHLVGDDSSIVWTESGPVIVYQDATTHELLISYKGATGFWEFTSIAGSEITFAGAFGFYASAAASGEEIVISNWVLDPPNDQAWVQIHREQVGLQ